MRRASLRRNNGPNNSKKELEVLVTALERDRKGTNNATDQDNDNQHEVCHGANTPQVADSLDKDDADSVDELPSQVTGIVEKDALSLCNISLADRLLMGARGDATENLEASAAQDGDKNREKGKNSINHISRDIETPGGCFTDRGGRLSSPLDMRKVGDTLNSPHFDDTSNDNVGSQMFDTESRNLLLSSSLPSKRQHSTLSTVSSEEEYQNGKRTKTEQSPFSQSLSVCKRLETLRGTFKMVEQLLKKKPLSDQTLLTLMKPLISHDITVVDSIVTYNWAFRSNETKPGIIARQRALVRGKSMIFLPAFGRSHWRLYCLKVTASKTKAKGHDYTLECFDSLKNFPNTATNHIISFVEDVCDVKVACTQANCFQKQNNNDCGVYTAAFAYCIASTSTTWGFPAPNDSRLEDSWLLRQYFANTMSNKAPLLYSAFAEQADEGTLRGDLLDLFKRMQHIREVNRPSFTSPSLNEKKGGVESFGDYEITSLSEKLQTQLMTVFRNRAQVSAELLLRKAKMAAESQLLEAMGNLAKGVELLKKMESVRNGLEKLEKKTKATTAAEPIIRSLNDAKGFQAEYLSELKRAMHEKLLYNVVQMVFVKKAVQCREQLSDD